MHAHRGGVHDLDAIDGTEVGARAQRRGLDALQAELHRLRVELLAVVELDALAELDFPDGGRDELGKLGGQSGDDLEIVVALHEAIEDVPGDHGGGGLLLVHGVERGRVHSLGDDDLALGRGVDPRSSRRYQDRGGQDRG